MKLGLSSVSASDTRLDVKSSYAHGLGLLSIVLSSQHSSVGRGLVTIGIHLYATGVVASDPVVTEA